MHNLATHHPGGRFTIEACGAGLLYLRRIRRRIPRYE
jgi:hypothetical protein